MSFTLLKKSSKSLARLGSLKTAHGIIKTPFFMPVATQGAVKTLSAEEIESLKPQIVLSNTYHLFLKPGLKILKKAGGLHKFMNWRGPILTDSGGFQVFSLQDKHTMNNGGLVKLSAGGVEFKSVYDGSKHIFTPEKVLEIQNIIGSDIRMILDVCSPAKCDRIRAEKDLAMTLSWAKTASQKNNRLKNRKHLLFGIVQGVLFKDLRLESARVLTELNFDGYAVGGLAVGETPAEMNQVLDYTAPALPEKKARYLMGVGYPEQIVEAVKRGIDMFDCVIPSREARHSRLYFFAKKIDFSRANFYHTINIKSEKFSRDAKAINSDSVFLALRNYSKSYLRHLFNVGEPLALRLATLNNLEFYLSLMAKIRVAIKEGKL